MNLKEFILQTCLSFVKLDAWLLSTCIRVMTNRQFYFLNMKDLNRGSCFLMICHEIIDFTWPWHFKTKQACSSVDITGHTIKKNL